MYKKQVYGTWFLLPALVVYSILFIIPVLAGIGYSFTNWNSFSPEVRFVGLRNYRDMFNPNNAYTLAIVNTFRFTIVATLGKMSIGLLFALFLNRPFRSHQVMRGVYFMPFAVSSLIIGIVFSSILAPNGLFNEALRAIGLDSLTRGWLVNRDTALNAIIAVDIWRSVGLNIVIFLAGLQMIDKEYYESASLDGAGAFASFWYITWPFLRPSLTISLILNTIHGLRVFDMVMALTNGGPGNATQVVSTFVFRTFSMGAFGLSNALSTFLFLVIAIITICTFKLIAPKES